MNEEISRILQMVEAGKISADEAERLIRAVNEGGPRGAHSGARADSHAGPAHEGEPFEPFHGLRQVVRWLSEAQTRAMRRQIRWYWWRRYRCDHWEARQRQQRADTMSVADRVRFVLLERAQVDSREPRPTQSLAELLGTEDGGWESSSRIAWETLRLGLEEEFGLSLDAGELRAVPTLQALIEYVEARVPPKAEAQPRTEPDAAGSPAEPPSAPAPPASPVGRGARAPKPAVEEPQASESE